MRKEWAKRFLSANSMFLGILAVIVFFFPKISVLVAIVAIMLGIAALVKIGSHPKHFEAPAMAVIGLIFAVAAILYATTSVPLVQDLYGYQLPFVPTPEEKCPDGTLLVGLTCCEDGNNDGICDEDEGLTFVEEVEEEPEVEEEEEIIIEEEEPEVEEEEEIPVVEPEEEVVEEEEEVSEEQDLIDAQLALINYNDFRTTNVVAASKHGYGEIGDTVVFVITIYNEYANDIGKAHYYKVRLTTREGGNWIQNADSIEGDNYFFGIFEAFDDEYVDVPIIMKIGHFDDYGRSTEEGDYEFRVDVTEAYYSYGDFDEYEDPFNMYVNVQ